MIKTHLASIAALDDLSKNLFVWPAATAQTILAVASTAGDALHPTQTNLDTILNHLTARQHLRPQAAIQQVLEEMTELYGCCPQAIARGMDWLGIDPAVKIGRLRRSELIQLARSVHRFWMQNLAAATDAS
jgi:hypothetical protein